MKPIVASATPVTSESSAKLLKASEVASILNISKAFAYKLMQTGQLATVNIGASRRVRLADLEEFITRNTVAQRQ